MCTQMGHWCLEGQHKEANSGWHAAPSTTLLGRRGEAVNSIFVTLLGTPEKAGVMQPFRPYLGPR